LPIQLTSTGIELGHIACDCMSRDPAYETVRDRNRNEVIRQGPFRPTVTTYPPSGVRHLRFKDPGVNGTTKMAGGREKMTDEKI
jgi:hypothetical protein